jgi:sensor histidine kinase regulating citrate/malate metabolism
MSQIYDALIKAAKKRDLIKDSVSAEGGEATKPLSISWQDISLEWKIMILIFAVLFVVIVHQLMGRALRTQIDQRTEIMVTNLIDAGTGHVFNKDLLQLKTLVTKYARLRGVAYAVIKDGDGRVIAHSLATLSPELQEALTSDQRRQVNQRQLTLQGKTVHETRGPILEGQLGTAHLGIWADAVNKEIYQALFMFLWPITLGLLTAAIIAVFLARRWIGPLRRWIEVPVGSAQAPSTDR